MTDYYVRPDGSMAVRVTVPASFAVRDAPKIFPGTELGIEDPKDCWILEERSEGGRFEIVLDSESEDLDNCFFFESECFKKIKDPESCVSDVATFIFFILSLKSELSGINFPLLVLKGSKGYVLVDILDFEEPELVFYSFDQEENLDSPFLATVILPPAL